MKRESKWKGQAESNRWQHNKRSLWWATVGLYSIDGAAERLLLSLDTIYATGGEEQKTDHKTKINCAVKYNKIQPSVLDQMWMPKSAQLL